MKNELTKTQIRNLRSRIKFLEIELKDPTCEKFPTARMHVQAELDKTRAALEAAR